MNFNAPGFDNSSYYFFRVIPDLSNGLHLVWHWFGIINLIVAVGYVFLGSRNKTSSAVPIY